MELHVKDSDWGFNDGMQETCSYCIPKYVFIAVIPCSGCWQAIDAIQLWKDTVSFHMWLASISMCSQVMLLYGKENNVVVTTTLFSLPRRSLT